MKTTAQIEDDLNRALDTIRGLWPVLLPTTVPAPGTGSGGGGKRSVADKYDPPDDSDLPLSDRRISLRHDVTMCLNSWARVIVEDRGTTHGIPLGHDTIGLCAFISRHAQWFSGHEAALDALEELETWATKVRTVALPATKDWLTLGPCPFVVDPTGHDEGATHFCTGTIRGYGDQRDPHCTRCKQTAVVEWWETVLRVTVRFVTAEDLVRVIHLEFGRPTKPATIRQWVTRQWITPARDEEGEVMVSVTGAHLYDAGEVVSLLTRRWAA